MTLLTRSPAFVGGLAISKMLGTLCLLLTFVFSVAVASGAGAQSTPEAQQIDYNRWTAIAETAEALIDNRNATEEALTNIRTQVSDLRAQFLVVRDAQQLRVNEVQAQIAALGPLPEGDAEEAPEIAARRAELTEQLTQRQTPLLAAVEAFARAEVIIRGIDRELRARQADALLTLGPSPLAPGNWLAAMDGMLGTIGTAIEEITQAWKDPARSAERITDLPITLGALALAFLMLLRGRTWMEHLTGLLLSSTAILRGRVAAAFVVSLSQLLVPFIGLLLLTAALSLLRLSGPRIDAVVDALVPAGMALFVARWLSLHIFPIVEDRQLSLNLDERDKRKARVAGLLLGLVVGVETLTRAAFDAPGFDTGALATIDFPILVIAAFLMFQLARILARHTPRRGVTETGEEIDQTPYFDRMIVLMTRLLTLVAIVAPLLGAAGYMAASRQLVFPAIDSLALIALLMVLHRLVTAIYAAIIGDDTAASNGLIPALSGLVLSILAIGPLALIWGARTTDLLEVYTTFSEGVSLGETRLSPATLLWFVIVFIIGYTVTRVLQGALGTSVLPKTSMEKGAQKALVSGVGYVGITAAALIAFSSAGIDLSGLAIVAGALSVGIGFGLQNIVSNFVSGIILLIERPVSEGDWVEVGTTSGIIQNISVRSTMIETFDRSKVIVPNADLISGAVTNFTKSSKTGRLIVPVGVAYGSNTRKVSAILQEIAETDPLVVMDPKPSVIFKGFGADSMDFEIRAILRDVNFKLSVASEMNHKIAERFVEEGIEIPFAQRDIWLRNPEALNAKPATAPATNPQPTAPQPAPDRGADNAATSADQIDQDYVPPTR